MRLNGSENYVKMVQRVSDCKENTYTKKVFSCGWVFLSVLHYLQRGKTREYREQFLFSRLCLICIPVNGSLDERRRWFLVGVYYLEQLWNDYSQTAQTEATDSQYPTINRYWKEAEERHWYWKRRPMRGLPSLWPNHSGGWRNYWGPRCCLLRRGLPGIDP